MSLISCETVRNLYCDTRDIFSRSTPSEVREELIMAVALQVFGLLGAAWNSYQIVMTSVALICSPSLVLLSIISIVFRVAMVALFTELMVVGSTGSRNQKLWGQKDAVQEQLCEKTRILKHFVC